MVNLSCTLGMHKWSKFMGPQNVGRGKFMQRYKCLKCGKIKKEVR